MAAAGEQQREPFKKKRTAPSSLLTPELTKEGSDDSARWTFMREQKLEQDEEDRELVAMLTKRRQVTLAQLARPVALRAFASSNSLKSAVSTEQATIAELLSLPLGGVRPSASIDGWTADEIVEPAQMAVYERTRVSVASSSDCVPLPMGSQEISTSSAKVSPKKRSPLSVSRDVMTVLRVRSICDSVDEPTALRARARTVANPGISPLVAPTDASTSSEVTVANPGISPLVTSTDPSTGSEATMAESCAPTFSERPTQLPAISLFFAETAASPDELSHRVITSSTLPHPPPPPHRETANAKAEQTTVRSPFAEHVSADSASCGSDEGEPHPPWQPSCHIDERTAARQTVQGAADGSSAWPSPAALGLWQRQEILRHARLSPFHFVAAATASQNLPDASQNLPDSPEANCQS